MSMAFEALSYFELDSIADKICCWYMCCSYCIQIDEKKTKIDEFHIEFLFFIAMPSVNRQSLEYVR